MLKQGDRITLDISDLTADGLGIGHYDGYAVFVPYVCDGEKVDAVITYVKRNIAYARLDGVVTPSEKRTTPLCPVFGICGACDLQHMNYAAQLGFKRNAVKKVFLKNASLDVAVEEVVPSENQYAYRNKLQLPVRFVKGRVCVGIFEKNSHNIVPITDCPLYDGWAKSVIGAVLSYIKENKITAYNEPKHEGLIRHIVARLVDGVLLLTLVINGDGLPNPDSLVTLLERDFDKFGLFYSINKRQTNVILGEKTVKVHGVDRISSLSYGVKFTLAPESFYQVNDGLKDKLYREAVRLAKLTNPDVIIDAYSGAGLLTCMLSSAADRVFAIELNRSAHLDAQLTAQQNGITNITHINGDVQSKLPDLLDSLDGKRVTLVTDPARKGMGAEALAAITRYKPQSIVYISCNADTQARDIAQLISEYDLISLQPFDQFPQTVHCETVALLTKRESR